MQCAMQLSWLPRSFQGRLGVERELLRCDRRVRGRGRRSCRRGSDAIWDRCMATDAAILGRSLAAERWFDHESTFLDSTDDVWVKTPDCVQQCDSCRVEAWCNLYSSLVWVGLQLFGRHNIGKVLWENLLWCCIVHCSQFEKNKSAN